MKNEKLKNKNFIDASKNAITGIIYTIKTQRNIKIQLVIAIIVIGFSIYFNLSITEWLFIVFAIMLVLICELINTAIEEAVNLNTDKFHPIAKISKDVAAGAVTLASLNAVIIGMIIFVDKIFK